MRVCACPMYSLLKQGLTLKILPASGMTKSVTFTCHPTSELSALPRLNHMLYCKMFLCHHKTGESFGNDESEENCESVDKDVAFHNFLGGEISCGVRVCV